MECFTYPAFPAISRALNGLVVGQILKRRLAMIWCWDTGFTPMATPAPRAARALDLPCVLGALGSDIHVRSGINAVFTRKTVRNVDALLTGSENMREAAIQEFGASPEKVHPMVNGYNTNQRHTYSGP
jgi:hypothetical protein